MISPTLQLKGVSWGSPSRWILKQTSLRLQSWSSNSEHLHTEAWRAQEEQGLDGLRMKSIHVAVTVTLPDSPTIRIQVATQLRELVHQLMPLIQYDRRHAGHCRNTQITTTESKWKPGTSGYKSGIHLYSWQALLCYLHGGWMLISLRGWIYSLFMRLIININNLAELLYKLHKKRKKGSKKSARCCCCKSARINTICTVTICVRTPENEKNVNAATLQICTVTEWVLHEV